MHVSGQVGDGPWDTQVLSLSAVIWNNAGGWLLFQVQSLGGNKNHNKTISFCIIRHSTTSPGTRSFTALGLSCLRTARQLFHWAVQHGRQEQEPERGMYLTLQSPTSAQRPLYVSDSTTQKYSIRVSLILWRANDCSWVSKRKPKKLPTTMGSWSITKTPECYRNTENKW